MGSGSISGFKVHFQEAGLQYYRSGFKTSVWKSLVNFLLSLGILLPGVPEDEVGLPELLLGWINNRNDSIYWSISEILQVQYIKTVWDGIPVLRSRNYFVVLEPEPEPLLTISAPASQLRSRNYLLKKYFNIMSPVFEDARIKIKVKIIFTTTEK